MRVHVLFSSGINFKLRPIYSPGKVSNTSLWGPQSRSGQIGGEQKRSSPCKEWNSGRPVRSQLLFTARALPTRLSATMTRVPSPTGPTFRCGWKPLECLIHFYNQRYQHGTCANSWGPRIILEPMNVASWWSFNSVQLRGILNEE
jgi:hypothetical protein